MPNLNLTKPFLEFLGVVPHQLPYQYKNFINCPPKLNLLMNRPPLFPEAVLRFHWEFTGRVRSWDQRASAGGHDTLSALLATRYIIGNSAFNHQQSQQLISRDLVWSFTPKEKEKGQPAQQQHMEDGVQCSCSSIYFVFKVDHQELKHKWALALC